MAVTWAASGITEGVSSSGKRSKLCTLTPTGTYTTGGDAISPAILGLKGILGLQQIGLEGLVNAAYTVTLVGTAEAPLLKLYKTDTAAVTNNTEMVAAKTITGAAVFVRVEGY